MVEMFRLNETLLLLTMTTWIAGVTAVAQQPSPRKTPAPAQRTAPAKAQSQRTKPLATLDGRKQFVVDVVNSAVALPQPDQQDRLRVLNSAAGVVSAIRPAMAKQFAREGIRIEQELIQQGQAPAVSLLNSGYVDCATMPSFIENIPLDKVEMADQSLIGGITLCQKQALEPARLKLTTALDQGHLAARPLLALMEAVGPSTAWSQETFAKMFSNLPADTKTARTEAPNYAAMYSQMAPNVSKDAAKTAGLKFLSWLGKLDDSGEKNLSVNIATDAMKQVLGQKAYDEALATDVMARQVAQNAGQPGEIEHPEEESVSVLSAMGSKGKDRTDELNNMPSSLRAREAAASGFATGTDGNKTMAGRYFDIAFSALNDVWDNRSAKTDAPAVVEEVSEAAAHVDAVDALQRAQRLQDPSARAIGMIAVARVVAGGDSKPVAETR
jgi:hypothetical protein